VLSAAFIMAAISWMQHPVGHAIDNAGLLLSRHGPRRPALSVALSG
jgi:hypothetical protein